MGIEDRVATSNIRSSIRYLGIGPQGPESNGVIVAPTKEAFELRLYGVSVQVAEIDCLALLCPEGVDVSTCLYSVSLLNLWSTALRHGPLKKRT
jgi:hypothetical protein